MLPSTLHGSRTAGGCGLATTLPTCAREWGREQGSPMLQGQSGQKPAAFLQHPEWRDRNIPGAVELGQHAAQEKHLLLLSSLSGLLFWVFLFSSSLPADALNSAARGSESRGAPCVFATPPPVTPGPWGVAPGEATASLLFPTKLTCWEAAARPEGRASWQPGVRPWATLLPAPGLPFWGASGLRG